MKTTELTVVHGVKDRNAQWKQHTVSYVTLGLVGEDFDRKRVEHAIQRALDDLEATLAVKESFPKGR